MDDVSNNNVHSLHSGITPVGHVFDPNRVLGECRMLQGREIIRRYSAQAIDGSSPLCCVRKRMHIGLVTDLGLETERLLREIISRNAGNRYAEHDQPV